MFKKILLLAQIIKNYTNSVGVIYNVFLRKKGFIIAKMRNGNSFLVRCNSRDFNTINEIFLENTYEGFMRKIKYKGGVIIDIGQNIGCFSIKASRIFKGAKIIGFEPFFDSCQIARINIILNQLSSRVESNEYAVSGKNGIVDFYTYPENHDSNSVNNLWGKRYETYAKIVKKIKVKSINLPDFVNKRRIESIDLLKIDCEGSEYEIIKSLSKKDFRKIRNIILEFHNGSTDIENTLIKNDFKLHKIVKSSYPHFLIANNPVSGESGIIFAEKEL